MQVASVSLVPVRVSIHHIQTLDKFAFAYKSGNQDKSFEASKTRKPFMNAMSSRVPMFMLVTFTTGQIIVKGDWDDKPSGEDEVMANESVKTLFREAKAKFLAEIQSMDNGILPVLHKTNSSVGDREIVTLSLSQFDSDIHSCRAKHQAWVSLHYDGAEDLRCCGTQKQMADSLRRYPIRGIKGPGFRFRIEYLNRLLYNSDDPTVRERRIVSDSSHERRHCSHCGGDLFKTEGYSGATYWMGYRDVEDIRAEHVVCTSRYCVSHLFGPMQYSQPQCHCNGDGCSVCKGM